MHLPGHPGPDKHLARPDATRATPFPRGRIMYPSRGIDPVVASLMVGGGQPPPNPHGFPPGLRMKTWLPSVKETMKSVLPKLDFEYEHFGRSWAKPLIPSVQVGGRATPWTVAHELGHVMDRSYPVPGLPGELSRAMANHTEDVTRGYGPEMAMANMSHASKPSERVASLWADYWTDPRRTGDFAQRADSTLQAGHGWDPRNIVKTRAAFQRRK